MSILSDKEIYERATNEHMIDPFFSQQINTDQFGNKAISYGLSSYGYDIRLADEFVRFISKDLIEQAIDPKKIKGNLVKESYGESFRISPGEFVLGRSVERFKIPKDVLGICIGKSTYARCGIIVNITPLEPEWEGTLTVEISNTTRQDVKIYANEGIAQIVFVRADNPCEISYAMRRGKYQDQEKVTLPRM